MGPPAVAAPPGAILAAPYRRLTVGTVLVVSFVAFEAMAVATVLPVVVHHLGGIALYGWVFSAFTLAQVGGIVLAGRLVDRAGMARPFVAAAALFALGLLIDGAAPSMGVLVAGRVVQGVGGGIVAVVVNVAVGRGYPPALRPRAYAALSAAWVLPALVGPPVAGTVATGVGWRMVFLALVPAVGLGAIVALPPLASAGPVSAPSPRQRAGAPGTRVAAAVAATASLAFFGTEAFVPLALTSLHHASAALAGSVLTGSALTWAVGSLAQARWHERLGSRVLAAAGMALVALGIAGAASVLSTATPWPVAYAAWGAAGAGMGLAYPTASLVVLASAGDRHGGPVAAMQVLVTLGVALGTGTGAGALAWSVTHGHGRVLGMAITDAAMLVAAIAGLALCASMPGRAGSTGGSPGPQDLTRRPEHVSDPRAAAC